MLNYLKDNFFQDKFRWILWLPIFLLIGIFTFFYFYEINYRIPINIINIITILLIFIQIIFFKKPLVKLLVLPLFFMFSGYLRSYYFYQNYDFPKITYDLGYVKIIGTVVKIETKMSLKNVKYKEIEVEIENIEPIENSFEDFVLAYSNKTFQKPKKLLIRLAKVDENVEKGKVILEAIVYPITKKIHKTSFDFEKYYYFKKIGGVGYRGKIVENTKLMKDLSFLDKINEFRLKFGNRIIEILPDKSGGVIATLITGNKKLGDQNVIQMMNYSGLAHLLAISGIHMLTLIGIVSFCVKWLLLRSEKIALHCNVFKISAIASLVINFFYLAISGFGISAIRAYIMSIVLLSAILIERFDNALRSAMFVLFAMAFINPYSIFNPGFQMSFASVIFLVAGYEYISERKEETDSIFFTIYNNKLFKVVFSIFITSIIAEMSTTPFSLYHFNNYTFYNVFANFIAVPLITFFVLPLSMLSLPLYFLNLEAFALIPAGFGVNIILKVCEYINTIPHSIIFVPSPNWLSMFLMIFGGIWFCLWQQKWRIYGIFIYFVGIIIIFLQQKPDLIIDYNSNSFVITDNNYNLYKNGNINTFTLNNLANKLGKNTSFKLEDFYKLKCYTKACAKLKAFNNNFIYYKYDKFIEITYKYNQLFIRNKNNYKIESINNFDYIYLK